MYRATVFAVFLFWHAVSSAVSCNVPVFDRFVLSNVAGNSDNLPLQIDMQPVAQLRMPTGFLKIGVLPSGSIGLGEHQNGVSALFGFETNSSVSVHKEGVTPAKFILSVFKGLDSDGCRYLESYQLESQDYRLHANLGKGAELFAFGKGGRHQFYLIRPDKPDFVLTGLLKNVSRMEFESILSTINIIE